jgi:hypothetical protein
MPIAVVGPVADTMSPIFTWATAAPDRARAKSRTAVRIGTRGSTGDSTNR